MFSPIALRITSASSTGKKKLQPGLFYYFLRGFNISLVDKTIFVSTRIEDNIYGLQYGNIPHISFSAIVGENGAGKSTIVELFLRIVNNLAASIFGEYSTLPGQPHLHYINGLNCELYTIIRSENSQIIKICIQERNVSIYSYSQCKIDSSKFILDDQPIYDNGHRKDVGVKDDTPFEAVGNFINGNLQVLADNLFYTYLSNYSHYSYNPVEFPNESTPSKYESKIRKTGAISLKYSQRHWLEGVFHRKESYQIPVLVYPPRENGNFDINGERSRAFHRLLAVLLSEKSQFRTINDHIRVVGFGLTSVTRDFNLAYIKKVTAYRFDQKGYDKVYNAILKEWGEIINENLADIAKQRTLGEDALAYLAYKTLKISCGYPRFYKFFFSTHENRRNAIDLGQLRQLVLQISKDASHVTRKLRQTLIYLKYGLFDFEEANAIVSINEISDECSKILNILKRPGHNEWLLCLRLNSIEELVPPPFINVNIILKDINSNSKLDFTSLSSGEKQFIYSISGLLYHIINLDSVQLNGQISCVVYKNLLLILEEIELYFHPDMQRRLIQGIIDGIGQLTLHNIRNIHTILVTHSPFILSDIPSRNIMALTKDGRPFEVSKETVISFGANIHDILRHPFFLKEGAQGKFAANFLTRLVGELNELASEPPEDGKAINLSERISLIDEPILRRVLLEKLETLTNTRAVKIKKIDEQIRELERIKQSL